MERCAQPQCTRHRRGPVNHPLLSPKRTYPVTSEGFGGSSLSRLNLASLWRDVWQHEGKCKRAGTQIFHCVGPIPVAQTTKLPAPVAVATTGTQNEIIFCLSRVQADALRF